MLPTGSCFATFYLLRFIKALFNQSPLRQIVIRFDLDCFRLSTARWPCDYLGEWALQRLGCKCPLWFLLVKTAVAPCDKITHIHSRSLAKPPGIPELPGIADPQNARREISGISRNG